MAQTIQIKRSTVTDVPSELATGELAYSRVGTDGGKLFVGTPGSVSGDVEAIGGKHYVDRSETAYNWGDHALAGYLVATSAGYNNTAWDTAYTYSQVGHLPLAGGTLTGDTSLETETNPTFTIKSTDAVVTANEVIGTLEFRGDGGSGDVLSGRIQQVAAQGGDWSAGSYGSNMSFSIKETGTGGDFSEKLRLQTSGVVLTGSLNVSGDTSLAGDLTVSGDTDLSGLTVGNITTSGYIRGPAAMVIDPADHDDVTGALTILGDLIVSGTTTTINSTVVETADERIELNSAQADDAVPPNTLVAGITVNRGSGNAAHILWKELSKGWYLSEDGPVDFAILHSDNWADAYTGVVEGGEF